MRTAWTAVGVGLVIAVIALSVLPLPQLPAPDVPLQDKWGHALAYGFLLWWLGQLADRRRDLALCFAALLALGGLLELVQVWLPNRQGEWWDLAADALGLAFGAALWLTPLGRMLTRIEARSGRELR